MDLLTLGLVVVILGLALVVLGILLSPRGGKTELRGAGLVMVGPIPIVFGSDAKWTSVAIALAIVLVFLSLLFYVM